MSITSHRVTRSLLSSRLRAFAAANQVSRLILADLEIMWSKLYAHSHSYPDCMIIKRSIKSAGTSIHTINTWTLLCETSVWHYLIRGPITARHFKVYFLAPRHAFLSFFTFHLTASDLSFLACHLTLPTFYEFGLCGKEPESGERRCHSQQRKERKKKKEYVSRHLHNITRLLLTDQCMSRTTDVTRP